MKEGLSVYGESVLSHCPSIAMSKWHAVPNRPKQNTFIQSPDKHCIDTHRCDRHQASENHLSSVARGVTKLFGVIFFH
jgi:hypothetical protein